MNNGNALLFFLHTPKSRRGVPSVPLVDKLAGELERHFQASPGPLTTSWYSRTR